MKYPETENQVSAALNVNQNATVMQLSCFKHTDYIISSPVMHLFNCFFWVDLFTYIGSNYG